MAFVNYDSKEIHCKVLYLGAEASGKTENLRSVFRSTSREAQAGLLEISDEGLAKQGFEFLPLSIGQVGGYHLKLHLYTLPSRILYETVPSVVMRGLDGFVFVVDSRVEAMADNIEAMLDIKALLAQEGYVPHMIPRVVQYNKRDLKGIAPVAVLRQELNPTGAPDCEAIAREDRGVLESLRFLTQELLKKLGAEPPPVRQANAGANPSI